MRPASSGTEYPRPRFPKDPKKDKSFLTWADVVPPRRASSSDEMVDSPRPSKSSRNLRYADKRRTVESAMRFKAVRACELIHKLKSRREGAKLHCPTASGYVRA